MSFLFKFKFEKAAVLYVLENDKDEKAKIEKQNINIRVILDILI